jgi:hypothetical protein
MTPEQKMDDLSRRLDEALQERLGKEHGVPGGDGILKLDMNILMCPPRRSQPTLLMEQFMQTAQESTGLPRSWIANTELAEADALVRAAGAPLLHQQVTNALKDEISRKFSATVQSIAASMRHQFRFPRSKRRRIRKKWAKNPANYRTGSHPALKFWEQPGLYSFLDNCIVESDYHDNPGGEADVERIIDGRDPYLDKAAKIFGVAPEDVTEVQRHLGKTQYLLDHYSQPPKP